MSFEIKSSNSFESSEGDNSGFRMNHCREEWYREVLEGKSPQEIKDRYRDALVDRAILLENQRVDSVISLLTKGYTKYNAYSTSLLGIYNWLRTNPSFDNLGSVDKSRCLRAVDSGNRLWDTPNNTEEFMANTVRFVCDRYSVGYTVEDFCRSLSERLFRLIQTDKINEEDILFMFLKGHSYGENKVTYFTPISALPLYEDSVNELYKGVNEYFDNSILDIFNRKFRHYKNIDDIDGIKDYRFNLFLRRECRVYQQGVINSVVNRAFGKCFTTHYQYVRREDFDIEEYMDKMNKVIDSSCSICKDILFKIYIRQALESGFLKEPLTVALTKVFKEIDFYHDDMLKESIKGLVEKILSKYNVDEMVNSYGTRAGTVDGKSSQESVNPIYELNKIDRVSESPLDEKTILGHVHDDVPDVFDILTNRVREEELINFINESSSKDQALYLLIGYYRTYTKNLEHSKAYEECKRLINGLSKQELIYRNSYNALNTMMKELDSSEDSSDTNRGLTKEEKIIKIKELMGEMTLDEVLNRLK